MGYIFRAVGSIYGIWNLDFFRSFNSGICLETDTLTTLLLDFVIAIYPLFLIALTYFLIILYDKNTTPLTTLLKPFLTFFSYFKKKWNIRTYTIDSFATFILLSNVKLLATCIDILTPIDVYQINSLLNVTHSRQLYYDATIQYFGPKHLPYAILALIRLVILIIYACTLTASAFPFACIVLVITATIIIIIDPFRNKFKNMSYQWVIHSLLLACFGVCACGLDILENTCTIKSPLTNVFYVITFVVVLLPVLGIVLVTFLFIFKKVFGYYFSANSLEKEYE